MQQQRRGLPGWAAEIIAALIFLGFSWWMGMELGWLLIAAAAAAVSITLPELIARREARDRERWLNRHKQ